MNVTSAFRYRIIVNGYWELKLMLNHSLRKRIVSKFKFIYQYFMEFENCKLLWNKLNKWKCQVSKIMFEREKILWVKMLMWNRRIFELFNLFWFFKRKFRNSLNIHNYHNISRQVFYQIIQFSLINVRVIGQLFEPKFCF